MIEVPRVHPTQLEARLQASGLWSERLLIDFVDAHARRTPDKMALVDNRGSLTYRALVEQTENLACSLVELGLCSGDVVAVQSPNWSELPVAHLALDRIGAIFLPLHDGFREKEMSHLLAGSHARMVVVPEAFHGFEHRELIRRLRPGLPALEFVVILRGQPKGDELGFDDLVANERWRHEYPADYLFRFRPRPEQPLQVMVSSGTTALPKCSLLSDNNSEARLVHQYGGYAVHLTIDDVAAAIAPAGTGATGYSYPVLALLLAGGTSVLLERWDGHHPEQVLALLEQHRCTGAVLIPTQLAKLVGVADIAHYDLSSLRYVTNAGAHLPEVVAEAAESLLGCRIQTIYGATDGGVPTMTSIDDPRDKRLSTVGRVLRGEEMCLLAGDGTPVVPGQPGEICWRGANKSFGYLNDPQANLAVWDEQGWYHSGDMGELDADGYLRVVGRKKDMIIRGGRNINPRLIEEVLLEHPTVMDVAVAPVPDPVLGEKICAFVVPRAGAGRAPRLEELIAFMQSRQLAVWYQPEQLVLMQDLPRNAGAKVDKAALTRLAGTLAIGTEHASGGPAHVVGSALRNPQSISRRPAK